MGALAEGLRKGDSDSLLLVGHSFGASSIVSYIQSDQVSKSLQGVIFLDLWPDPLESLHGVDVPFALLLSEEYAIGPDVPDLRKFLAVNDGQSIVAVSFNGTIHQWVSEAELFAPRFLLQSLNVTGSGDYAVYIDATNRVLQ